MVWVIANGAPKAGSTWLVQLLEATARFERVPLTLQADGWRNSSVADGKLPVALEDLPMASANYISKQHWADPKQEFLTTAGIKVLNIVRDVRDVVISRYHHNARVAGETLPLDRFVYKKGRKYVRDYCAYHRRWIRAAAVSRVNYHVSSYEHLSFDLTTAASKLYAFVGLSLTGEESERSARRTAFSRKRQTGPGSFFRKGKALAFSEEIGEDENELLLSFADEFDLAGIKRDIAEHCPALVKYLRMTDVGL